MGLKNYQYNRILRDYDRKQLENKHDLNLRVKEVYKKIPTLKEIDNTMIAAAMNNAKLFLTNSNEDLSLDNLKSVT